MKLANKFSFQQINGNLERQQNSPDIELEIFRDNLDNAMVGDVLAFCGLWPLLLTWFNFNLSMDK